MMFFDKTVATLCLQCGSEAKITYSTLSRQWIKTARYCPFCGCEFGIKEDSLIVFEKNDEVKERD